MKILRFNCLFGLTVLLCGAVQAKPPVRLSAYQRERSAISASVSQFLTAWLPKNKTRFAHLTQKRSPYTMETLDIQSDWALAYVKPRNDNAIDPVMPDGASFLLHRTKQGWRTLTMGTSLDNTRKYHVPPRLQKRWSL